VANPRTTERELVHEHAVFARAPLESLRERAGGYDPRGRALRAGDLHPFEARKSGGAADEHRIVGIHVPRGRVIPQRPCAGLRHLFAEALTEVPAIVVAAA